MTNWEKPSLTSTYTNFITELKYRDEVVGSLYSSDVTVTNQPADNSANWGVRSIRWNATDSCFQRRNSANNGWERLEGNSGTHKFVNLEASTITANSELSGGTIVTTNQLTAGRINVTGSTVPSNGLYLPANNELSFTSNSTRRLTIKSTGNCGIATDNPSQKLHVVGNTRIENGSNTTLLEIGEGGTSNRAAEIRLIGDETRTGTDAGFKILRGATGQNTTTEIIHRGTGDFTIEANEAADMYFKTDNTTRFVVDSGGNVGIGNFADSPQKLLHLKRAAADGIYIQLQNSEGSAYLGADGDALQLYGDSIFMFNENGSTTYLEVSGTLFDMKQNAKVNGNLEIQGTATGTFSGNGAALTNIPYSALTNTPTIPSAVTNNSQLTNGAGFTTYTANQNVNTSDSPTFEALTLNGHTLKINIKPNGDSNHASSTIEMGDSDNGLRKIHNNSNQIGFLTQGNSFGAFCDDNGNWTAIGNVTAYSDERLKENIETIPNALETVKKLRGVSFAKKDSGIKGIGVIAQEIEKVLPEVVVDAEYKSVSYGNIVGLLIEAIKELELRHKHGL